ncbi:MAG: hydrogen peroxide-inducible genes activator [Chitinophagaceae bacterium]|nr:MAG: hydrogen peroxide-inducible genes activator [Chitinophagaceae bacterium]
MTLTQLEYIVAVDNLRHFASAAAHCYVTQPTLSMQVSKLEQELGLKLFDRSKQPVIPTEAGLEILAEARKILGGKRQIEELVANRKGIVKGELKIGIIPTLAPYLLPLFLQSFSKRYPNVRIFISEMMTETIITRLREGRIDAGVLVTPLMEKGISESVLFYEELMVYVSKKNEAFKKSYVLAKDIDPNKLWMLEEGHCFRSQIVNLCELQKASRQFQSFEYEAGSIETLRRMVDINDGITIVPELSTSDLPASQQQQVRRFRSPAPMREVSIVVHRDYIKKRLVEMLKQEIMRSLPDKIRKNKNTIIVPV